MKQDNYQEIVLTYINGNPELSEFFKYYLNHCTSQCLPYHNIKHTFQMMYHIIMIFNNQDKEEFTISNYELLVLLVAALYHDYNHSGGLFSDDINVNNAITGYYDASFYIFNNVVENNRELEFSLNNDVELCIKATQYPYTTENVNKLEGIIRECDVISQISPDLFTHTIDGLRHELRNTTTWIDTLQKYFNFISPMLTEMKLNYSKEYVEKTSESFCNIITKSIEILK